MFTYQTQIFLHHTDAAGRLFFANQFYFMHEALEMFLDSLGMPIMKLHDKHADVLFPLVHAEADYKGLLVTGDRISINVRIDKLGETSVHFSFTIRKADGSLAGSGKTVSVCVNQLSGKKTAIPKEWREKLEKILQEKNPRS